MKRLLFGVLLFIGAVLVGFLHASEEEDSSNVVKSVQKRWVPRYPYNSCFALAVVVAIPLELKGRNVYTSWNFETNFYYPYFDNREGLVPLPFATIVEDDTNKGSIFVHAAEEQRDLNNNVDLMADATNQTTHTRSMQSEAIVNQDDEDIATTTAQTRNDDNPKRTTSRKTRQILDYFMSRKKFYKILESKLKSMGLNGRKCLLKTICESAAHPVNTYNGVLGDILHVVFTPSASADERLPGEFYAAEKLGQSTANCEPFSRQCPRSILDFISVFA